MVSKRLHCALYWQRFNDDMNEREMWHGMFVYCMFIADTTVGYSVIRLFCAINVVLFQFSFRLHHGYSVFN